MVLVVGVFAELAGFAHTDLDASHAYEGIVVIHDASAHRIGAWSASAEQAHEHCYVCHWVRSFHPAQTAGRGVSTDRVLAGRLNYEISAPLNRLVVSQLSPRSPPA